MRRNNKFKGTFFSLLVKSYLFFTVTVVFVLWILIQIEFKIEEGILKMPSEDLITSKMSILKAEHYSKLKPDKAIGKDGWFEIYDANGSIIYSSNSSLSDTHTLRIEDLNYLQEYDAEYQVQKYRTDKGENQILLQNYIYPPDGTEMDEYTSGYILLNEHYHVLGSTVSLKSDQLTKEEYQLMTGAIIDGYSAAKYEFATNLGEVRFLVAYTPNISDAAYKSINKIYNLVLPVFLVLYVLLTLFFILQQNKRVKQPLTLLNSAMVELSEGREQGLVNFKGPSEFEQICESFNKMSIRLEESKRKEEQLANEKKKMLIDISHDLKTPITVIQGYSKALCDGTILDSNKEKYINTIYHKSVQLTDLINSFYEYNKLEHPDFKLVLETIDIYEFIREYIAQKYEEIELADFIFEADIPTEEVFMEADRLQLTRAMENIVANALKHNPSGTMLFIKAKSIERQLIITIGDTGIGIPEAMKESIFEPFVVGDDSRNNKYGTGLGLAITKKIVEAHKGSIRLIMPPTGALSTEFEIILPLRE